MSYFRGDLYLWNDGDDNLHVWSETRDPGNDSKTSLRVKQMILLPAAIFDQLAVMRLAEMIRDNRLESAIDAATTGGNAGGLWLREMSSELKSRLRSLVEEWKVKKEVNL